MERLRRWILLGGFALAVMLVFHVSLSPLVIVTRVDFPGEQKNEGRSVFLDRPSEHEQYLRQLPLDEYLAEKTKDKLVPVAGEDWERFFERVQAAATDPAVPKELSGRISPGSLPDKRYIFFRPTEEPLATLQDRWQTDGQEFLLQLERAGQSEYLRLRFQRYSSDDVRFGSGFSRHPEPPSGFLHPFRAFGPWVFAAALGLYLFLPGTKREPDALFYARWRCMLGDFVALLLFGLFFSLPVFVSGGTLQAFLGPGLFLVFIMWPLAAMGGLIAYYQGWYAAYSLRILEDRLEVTTISERGEYRFADMASFETVSLRAPRWLVAALRIASLFAKGGARFTALGQSFILGGSEHGGLGIRLRNGSTLYLWITDQMGGQALKAAGRIVSAMKAAGVPQKEEPRVLQALMPPTFEAAGGKKRASSGARFLLVLAALPFLAIGTLLGIDSCSRTWRAVRISGEPETEEQAATRAAPAWTHPAMEWHRALHPVEGHSARGTVILATRDGGFVAAVHLMPGFDVQALVIRTDSDGQPLWETSCGSEELWDYAEAIVEVRAGGFLTVGASRPPVGHPGASQVHVARIAAAGEKAWERNIGGGETETWGYSAIEKEDGTFLVAALSDTAVRLFRLDGAGGLLSEETLDGLVHPGDELKTLLLDEDGGILAAGITLSQGTGFKDLLLVKADPQGNPLWRTTAGGRHLEQPLRLRRSGDDGYLAAGLTRSLGGGGEDAYLVKVDASGNLLWEKAYGGEADERAVDVLEMAGGGCALLAQADASGGALHQIYLIQTDRLGNPLREERIGREGHYVMPAALAEAADGSLIITGALNRSGYLADQAFVIKLRLSP